ncbi:helix-turn-helix domain-containing protein [Verrucomicrobium spinosum]|uniref:helix-turn-helix domain-containing protein n=1 Tax=Verrucomicrobium spinosum TaxID=2736 RepID=UPI00155DD6F1|nr:helix-turn-helix domain-containing protein [Verrucomicrobium spinosum]
MSDASYFVKDSRGRFMAAGGGLLQHLGVKGEEDLLSSTDFAFFPPHLAHAMRMDDLRVMQTRQPMVDRLELLHSNRGTKRWHLTTKLPLIGPDGTPMGIMGVVRPCNDASDPAVPQQVRKAVAYIHDHFSESLSTAFMAKKVHASARHLNRLFHNAFGMGVQDFILRTRVAAVCQCLLCSNKPVADIAYEHGFYDQSAMSRYFRQYTGESPHTWRHRHRSAGSRPLPASGTAHCAQAAAKTLQDAFFAQLSSHLPLRQLLEHLPDMDYFTKDCSGRFTAIRSATVIRLGFRSEEEALGITDFDIHPAKVAEAIRNDDLHIMRTRQPMIDQLEELYTRPSVKGRFLTTKLPVTDRNEQVIGVMGFIRPAPGELLQVATRTPVELVVAHIRERHFEKLLISDLASIGKVSPRQLNRMFQESYRLSAQDFIIRTRVQAACADLVSTRNSLAEIACAHGFCDASTFTRQFKHHMGETPLIYRRRRTAG